MANAIVKVFLKLAKSLLGVVLAPLNILINALIPNFSNYITPIYNLFNLILNSIGYVIDLLGISNVALTIVVLTITYNVLVMLSAYSLKIGVKWYRALMP